MKSLLVFYDPDLTTELEDIPIPEYGDDEVLIQVVAAGSNPKDWKHPMPNYFNVKLNQGDDAAGIVSAVGARVTGIRPGDRVAAFHVMDTPRGSYAEYAVAPANTVFHIPESLSFEEAATIPLAAYTAAVGLFRNLRLPLPFERSDASGVKGTAIEEKIPLVINGASSAVGAFAVKLAKLSPSIGPIIGVAGGSQEYARKIGVDVIVDYRGADVTSEIRKALGGRKLYHVFDATNSAASVDYLVPVLEGQGSRYTSTTGMPKEADQKVTDAGIWNERIWVGSIHEDKLAGGKLFGRVISVVLEEAIKSGDFSGQPYEIVKGGLTGVKDALVQLRDRKGGNTKFVTRIADTPGL